MSEATVVIASKPLQIPALRSTWRKAAEQKVAQLWRFLRVAVVAFGTQIVGQVIANGDISAITHLDQKALVALVAGALETAWRQFHPAFTASAADSAPGVTIVPAQVETPAGEVPPVVEGDAAP